MSASSADPPDRPDVLIVEDNDDGRETLRMLFELRGLRVDTAADGAQGVQRGIARRPRAAVVDIGLPILDGFDVARELRRALGRDVLLIANTAYTGDDMRERSRLAGFDHFLCKPCDIDELVPLLLEATQDPPSGSRR